MCWCQWKTTGPVIEDKMQAFLEHQCTKTELFVLTSAVICSMVGKHLVRGLISILGIPK